MKKWVCNVCGYIHEGETPPEVCPVCGVGPEEFSLLEEAAVPKKSAPPKRWKCTVCDYIHVGDQPPEICPLCGVGSDKFVLLVDEIIELTAESIATADDGTTNAAMDSISYGLYVVSSTKDGKINAQICNTVFQLTSNPLQIAACINKRNLTNEYITASGRFAVSVLAQDQRDTVKVFGYQSGRNADKFAGIKHLPGKNGCPVLADCLSYIEAEVIPEKVVDVGTHTLFIARVTAGRLAAKREPMTYAYFRETKKS